MVPKETIKKFQTSVINVVIDKPSLKQNILKTKVTLINKVTHQVVNIKNLQITQSVNNKPVGKGPEMTTKLQPSTMTTVILRVTATVPNVGSRTKDIVMPIQNNSESHK